MINRTLLAELWRRALEREELGLFVQVDNSMQNSARFALSKSRPSECAGFTVVQTSDPSILFIVRPGVNLFEESDRHALAEVFNDLT